MDPVFFYFTLPELLKNSNRKIDEKTSHIRHKRKTRQFNGKTANARPLLPFAKKRGFLFVTSSHSWHGML